MRSKLIKLVLGCGLAAAFAAPAFACEFNRTSAQGDQTVAQAQTYSSQTTDATDAQPAPDKN